MMNYFHRIIYKPLNIVIRKNATLNTFLATWVEVSYFNQGFQPHFCKYTQKNLVRMYVTIFPLKYILR